MLGVMLQWLGGGGFSFTNMMQYLDQWGFFTYFLPFLLIFALVYAITSQLKIFKENKGAGVIVALAIGFLSLVGGYVPTFFAQIIPKMGVGLSIMLAGLLIAGVFLMENEKGKNAYPWIFLGLGGLVFFFVVFSSMSNWEFYGSGNWSLWWDQYAGLFIFLLIMIGVVVAVSLSNKNKP